MPVTVCTPAIATPPQKKNYTKAHLILLQSLECIALIMLMRDIEEHINNSSPPTPQITGPTIVKTNQYI